MSLIEKGGFCYKTVFVFALIVLTRDVLAKPVLEETVITAQHRAENNQRAAVAVTVLDSATLFAADFDSAIDLGPETPGLTVTSYNSANPQYFIRGVGSTGTSAGEDPSVSVFVDGAYAGRGGTTSMDFLDVQRVEVLRGPQGTLFGRNASGGLIHLISQKPVHANTAYVSAYTGSFDEHGVEGSINSILSERADNNNVLSRISFMNQKRDGYVTNASSGSDQLRESEDSAFRWHVLKKFSSRSRALLTLNYADSDQLGTTSRKAKTSSNPLIVAGFIPLPQPSSDIDTVTLSTDGPTTRETSGVKLKVEHAWEYFTFESMSAWQNSEYQLEEDVSAVGLIVLSQDEDTEQYSQEFRLLSNANSARVWTLGVYYFQETVDRIDITDVTAVSDIYSAVLAPIPDEIAHYDQNAKNSSWAVYGQTEIPLSEKIDLVLGGRYTRDSKNLNLVATGADPLLFGILPMGPFNGVADDDFSNFSTKVGVNYSASEHAFWYAQFSQGYKSGGFDGNATTAISLAQSFDEETADTLELGLKAQWLDNRLRTNAALFYTEYEDLQVFQVTNTGRQFLDNAASATIKGVELEMDLLFSEQLASHAACTFLDSSYDDFISEVDDDLDGQPDDLSGNTLTRSPQQNCSLALTYSPLFTGEQPMDLRVSYAYQDEIFITPQNRSLDTVDAFYVVNMSVQYRISAALSLGFFGKNLTDESYSLHAYDADPLVRNNIQSTVYAEPRTWKASIRYDF